MNNIHQNPFCLAANLECSANKLLKSVIHKASHTKQATNQRGRLVVLCLLLFMAAGCKPEDKICLSSAKSVALDSVSVEVAEKIIWSGSLQPHEIKIVSFVPAADGHITLKWIGNGKNQVTQSVGYVTPNGRQEHSVSILDNDTLHYKSPYECPNTGLLEVCD